MWSRESQTKSNLDHLVNLDINSLKIMTIVVERKRKQFSNLWGMRKSELNVCYVDSQKNEYWMLYSSIRRWWSVSLVCGGGVCLFICRGELQRGRDDLKVAMKTARNTMPCFRSHGIKTKEENSFQVQKCSHRLDWFQLKP